MPRRTILTDRQRSALFDLPVDEPSLRKHYTLADDDLQHIGQRRRAENCLGFALQLCALRHSGRALQPGELIPSAVVEFIGAQLGVAVEALLPYAARRQTRQEHMTALRSIYGYRAFAGRGARHLKDWLDGQAEEARSNAELARRRRASQRPAWPSLRRSQGKSPNPPSNYLNNSYLLLLFACRTAHCVLRYPRHSRIQYGDG